MKHNAFWYRKSHLGVLIALIFFGLAACEEEADCTTDSTNVASVEFTKLISNEGSNSEEDIADDILISKPGNDTPFQLTPTGFPLDPASNSTTLYIFREIDNTSTIDTIVLNYQREQTLISPDCGPDQRFFGISIDTSQTTFDSVWVRNAEVASVAETVNLRIFTCRYEMTNVFQLRFNYPQDEDDEVTDTIFVRRVYSSIGKEDLLQNDTIPEGGGLTVAVPVTMDSQKVQVFLETEEENSMTYDLEAFYQQDTFQAAHCLAQDRYRLDSVRLGINPGRLDTIAIENETFNLNNPINAEVTIE
ncbi:MAG: DUF6452 family protein [Bacteroidota bacterium]